MGSPPDGNGRDSTAKQARRIEKAGARAPPDWSNPCRTGRSGELGGDVPRALLVALGADDPGGAVLDVALDHLPHLDLRDLLQPLGLRPFGACHPQISCSQRIPWSRMNFWYSASRPSSRERSQVVALSPMPRSRSQSFMACL